MQIQEQVPLAHWCTLKVGGPARWFANAEREDEVLSALEWARAREVPVYVLGGGSNVVIADAGVDGLVLRVSVSGVSSIDRDGRRIFTVGAGEAWDPFVRMTVDANCAGLECLSGIPGLVGGTPVQNVGAYGQDVSGVITQVRVIDRKDRRVLTLSAEECGFGYRTSRFKREDERRFVVCGVDFALTPGGRPNVTYADVIAYFRESSHTPSLREVRDAILAIRRRKGMVIEPGNPANHSVGSFFVNPVVERAKYERLAAARGAHVPHYVVDDARVKIPAAWLIEQAGFARGHEQGSAGISPFQAQGLINRGGATAADIVALALAIKRAVWTTFDIALVPEPVFVGFPPDAELQWLLNPNPGH